MSLIVFPAIDLKEDQVVRLAEGDMDRATIYGDDPADQARIFAEAGAGQALDKLLGGRRIALATAVLHAQVVLCVFGIVPLAVAYEGAAAVADRIQQELDFLLRCRSAGGGGHKQCQEQDW